jgi:hypothetical protein
MLLVGREKAAGEAFFVLSKDKSDCKNRRPHQQEQVAEKVLNLSFLRK